MGKLVITRKAGERICLGDDVTITVIDISGSTVRLGIEAPAEIPVRCTAYMAEEIYACHPNLRSLRGKPCAGGLSCWYCVSAFGEDACAASAPETPDVAATLDLLRSEELRWNFEMAGLRRRRYA